MDINILGKSIGEAEDWDVIEDSFLGVQFIDVILNSLGQKLLNTDTSYHTFLHIDIDRGLLNKQKVDWSLLLE